MQSRGMNVSDWKVHDIEIGKPFYYHYDHFCYIVDTKYRMINFEDEEYHWFMQLEMNEFVNNDGVEDCILDKDMNIL